MRPKKAICSLTILLTACSQPNCLVTVKDFSRDEQRQIASERNTIVDSSRNDPLFHTNGDPAIFLMTPAVLDDWERMRREAR